MGGVATAAGVDKVGRRSLDEYRAAVTAAPEKAETPAIMARVVLDICGIEL